MISLDVHVLTLPGLPLEWVEQRRASLIEAAAQAGYPVHVHEVEGIPGHLGRSRKKGYAVGTATYVTHVDHDDWVHPGAFAMLRPHMECGDTAFTTGEVLVLEDGRQVPCPDARHHLAVFRRDAIAGIQIERFRHFPDQFLLAKVPAEHTPRCLYYHRIWQASASRQQRRASAVEAEEEMAVVKDPSLFAVECMSPADIAAAQEAYIDG